MAHGWRSSGKAYQKMCINLRHRLDLNRPSQPPIVRPPLEDSLKAAFSQIQGEVGQWAAVKDG